MEAWAQLLTVNFRFESVTEESSSAQKRAFKDTPLLFLNDLRTRAVELLYKLQYHTRRPEIWLYITTAVITYTCDTESQPWRYTAISHFYSCDIANILYYIDAVYTQLKQDNFWCSFMFCTCYN